VVSVCLEVYQGQNLLDRLAYTGHICLNEHLHRMGLASDPLCAACRLEEESALHFICTCLSLSNIRTHILCEPTLSVCEYEENSAINFFCNLLRRVADSETYFLIISD
jgi:hypothetical protein